MRHSPTPGPDQTFPASGTCAIRAPPGNGGKLPGLINARSNVKAMAGGLTLGDCNEKPCSNRLKAL